MSAPGSRTNTLVLYVGLIVVASCVALRSSDTTYDYRHYGGQWQHVLDGGNPWEYARGDLRRFNSYGPLHALMAWPYAVSSLLPKLVYALASIAATIYLVSRATSHRAIVLFLVLNPPLWILYVHGGFNDALIGALFLFGIVAFDRGRFALSAVLLGLAILYKFTPIFIVPFLCLHRRRVRWAFAAPLAGTLGLGFGAAYVTWGASLLDPVRVGASRPSSSASIFNFLDEHLGNVDFLSIYVLAGALLAIFACYVIYDLEVRHCVVLALSCAFLFYRANHLQFYVSLTLLSVYLVIEEHRRIQAIAPALLRSLGAFLVWLCVVVTVWKICDREGKQVLHRWIGLPTFLLHLGMNVALVVYMVRNRRPEALPSSRGQG